MEIEVVQTCPLGSVCEEVRDSKIHRCAWLVKLQGEDPQSGKPVDQSKCAMAWQPILMIENSGISKEVAGSVQSLRNETVNRQDAALEVFRNAQNIEHK